MITLGTIVLILGVMVMGWMTDRPTPWQVGQVTIYLANLLAFAALLAGFGKVVTDRWGGVALSGRNFFSLSRLQMAGWTVVVLATVLTAAELRLWGKVAAANLALDINIPGEILAAMGIAVFTTAATPALLSLKTASPSPQATKLAIQKVTDAAPADKKNVIPADNAAQYGNAAPATVGVSGSVLTRSDPSLAQWRDLVTGDEVATADVVDLSKLQQLLISSLLLLSYIGMVAAWIDQGGMSASADPADKTVHTPYDTLPMLSQTFIGLMAISHAGYLAFKAVPKVERQT